MKILKYYGSPLVKLVLLGLMTTPVMTNAQKPNTPNSFQNDFYSFKNSINQQFDSFIQHNDSVFLQFLTQSWKEFRGTENKSPLLPKPVIQPRVEQPVIVAPPIIIDTTKAAPPIIDKLISPEKKDSIPPQKETLSVVPASISFYGTEIPIILPNNELPVLNSLTQEGIIRFFNVAVNSSMVNNLTVSIKKNAENCKLNDWGLASMLMSVSKKFYSSRNDQVLFTWYALIRNGFNPKVGFDQKQIYLLLPANEKVYSTIYQVQGKTYYLFDFEFNTQQPDLLSIYEGDYPGNKSGFSLLLTESPQFGNHNITKLNGPNHPIELKINQNLIDFYYAYPSCELKVFFAAPISDDTEKQLDVYFNPLLEGKNDDERVAFLLEFVQKGIPYLTDQQQFGREKYFFAEETLYYPGADCEDRAVLLAKLINRYTKLEAIGLLYPEHVSVAVNIKDIPGMKYFNYKDKHYYSCDPTYLGAQCGEIMTKLITTVPEIIDFKL